MEVADATKGRTAPFEVAQRQRADEDGLVDDSVEELLVVRGDDERRLDVVRQVRLEPERCRQVLQADEGHRSVSLDKEEESQALATHEVV